eukprot:g1564.t1
MTARVPCPALLLVLLHAAAVAASLVDPDDPPELQAMERGDIRPPYAPANWRPASQTHVVPAPTPRHQHLRLQVLHENVDVVDDASHCVHEQGQRVAVKVDYHSSDGKEASALSFRVVWDPALFVLTEESRIALLHMPGNLLPGCGISELLPNGRAGYVSYKCVSPATERPPVPHDLPHVLALELRTVRDPSAHAEGSALISVVADESVHGDGYRYQVPKPLNVRCRAYTKAELAAIARKCPAGKYGAAKAWRQNGAEIATADCTACAPGRYNPGHVHTAECHACGAGHYATLAGATHCTRCELGKFTAVDGSKSCFACAKGKHAAIAGAKHCTECGGGDEHGGMYADEEGLVVCKQCPAGKYQWARGKASCVQGEGCVVGRFHVPRKGDTGSFSCAACPRGKYQSRANARSCTACPSGKFQALAAQNACERSQCRAGELYCRQCFRGCAACATNHFSIVNADGVLQPGQRCDKCPEGKYQWMRGQDRCYGSRCKAGSYQFLHSNDCILCRPGKYQPQPAQESCIDCPKGKHSHPGAVECMDPRADEELLKQLLQAKKEAETPQPCSHMKCRLEVHLCKKVRVASADTGYIHHARDCRPKQLDEVPDEEHETWASIRSYHQTQEARGTMHRCGVRQATGKCQCQCWKPFVGQRTQHAQTAHEI